MVATAAGTVQVEFTGKLALTAVPVAVSTTKCSSQPARALEELMQLRIHMQHIMLLATTAAAGAQLNELTNASHMAGAVAPVTSRADQFYTRILVSSYLGSIRVTQQNDEEEPITKTIPQTSMSCSLD